MESDLITVTSAGLYCEAGGFYVDPWKAVGRAVITHAHSDHARPGSEAYLCSISGEGVLRERIGADAGVEVLPFGEERKLGEATVSLHPAGHILGSAQVKIVVGGEIWVISGDYKTVPDASCEAFEPVKCHTFISETTFGLPIYRWPETQVIFGEINQWWRDNQRAGVTSVVFAYALGKAQRILAGIDASIGPVCVHGAITKFLPYYERAGRPLAEVRHGTLEGIADIKGRGLVIAPASTQGTPWLRRFGPSSLAFASGWMRIRGARRRRALDRGFILSDHADWDGLVQTIRDTGADRVGLTHGYSRALSRWLREGGRDTFELPTRYTGEREEAV